MMKSLLLFLATAMVMLLGACTHDTPDLAAQPKMSFNDDVLPTLVASCSMSGCHDPSGTKKAPGGYLYDNYDDVMKSVTAFNPNSSKLYTVITGSWITRMPPKSHDPLTQDQRTKIWLWIKQGALNN